MVVVAKILYNFVLKALFIKEINILDSTYRVKLKC